MFEVLLFYFRISLHSVGLLEEFAGSVLNCYLVREIIIGPQRCYFVTDNIDCGDEIAGAISVMERWTVPFYYRLPPCLVYCTYLKSGDDSRVSAQAVDEETPSTSASGHDEGDDDEDPAEGLKMFTRSMGEPSNEKGPNLFSFLCFTSCKLLKKHHQIAAMMCLRKCFNPFQVNRQCI